MGRKLDFVIKGKVDGAKNQSEEAWERREDHQVFIVSENNKSKWKRCFDAFSPTYFSSLLSSLQVQHSEVVLNGSNIWNLHIIWNRPNVLAIRAVVPFLVEQMKRTGPLGNWLTSSTNSGCTLVIIWSVSVCRSGRFKCKFCCLTCFFLPKCVCRMHEQINTKYTLLIGIIASNERHVYCF
jgi:hypothetical protein